MNLKKSASLSSQSFIRNIKLFCFERSYRYSSVVQEIQEYFSSRIYSSLDLSRWERWIELLLVFDLVFLAFEDVESCGSAFVFGVLITAKNILFLEVRTKNLSKTAKNTRKNIQNVEWSTFKQKTKQVKKTYDIGIFKNQFFTFRNCK